MITEKKAQPLHWRVSITVFHKTCAGLCSDTSSHLPCSGTRIPGVLAVVASRPASSPRHRSPPAQRGILPGNPRSSPKQQSKLPAGAGANCQNPWGWWACPDTWHSPTVSVKLPQNTCATKLSPTAGLDYTPGSAVTPRAACGVAAQHRSSGALSWHPGLPAAKSQEIYPAPSLRPVDGCRGSPSFLFQIQYLFPNKSWPLGQVSLLTLEQMSSGNTRPSVSGISLATSAASSHDCSEDRHLLYKIHEITSGLRHAW